MSRAAELWDEAARQRRQLKRHIGGLDYEATWQSIKELEAEAYIRVTAEPEATEPSPTHEIYASETGDRWLLATNHAGFPRVRHLPYAGSGGQPTDHELDTFFAINGRHTPQHAGLLRLIATMLSQAG